MGLFVKETWTNETDGYQMGSKGVYESFTDNLKDLFLSCQNEHGRCIAACFIDLKGKPQKIGWVFEKKASFGENDKHFIQHTWVSVHKEE